MASILISRRNKDLGGSTNTILQLKVEYMHDVFVEKDFMNALAHMMVSMSEALDEETLEWYYCKVGTLNWIRLEEDEELDKSYQDIFGWGKRIKLWCPSTKEGQEACELLCHILSDKDEDNEKNALT